jgi:hypothetical protein
MRSSSSRLLRSGLVSSRLFGSYMSRCLADERGCKEIAYSEDVCLRGGSYGCGCGSCVRSGSRNPDEHLHGPRSGSYSVDSRPDRRCGRRVRSYLGSEVRQEGRRHDPRRVPTHLVAGPVPSRRKRVAVLVLGLVTAALFPFAPSALAHTSPTSSAEFSATAMPSGLTFDDPKLSFSSPTSMTLRVDWDLKKTAGTCANTNNVAFKVEGQKLDLDGQPVGSWSQFYSTGAGTFSNSCTDAAWQHQDDPLGLDGLTPGDYAGVRWRVVGTASPYIGVVYAEARSTLVGLAPPAPTAFGMLSTSPGGKLLSYDQGASLCWKYGWTTEDDLTECTAVMKQESSFRTKAVSYIGCCFGLLQVYASLHGVTEAEMYDPDLNVFKARDIYEDAGSWDPWEAWTGPDGTGSDGPWLQWESRAREAAKRQRSCGGCAYDSIATTPASDFGSITLGWSTTCAGCTYRVQRDNGGTFEDLGTTLNLSLVDPAAKSGTAYDYRVRSENEYGESEWVTTSATAGEPDPGSGVADGDEVATDEDGSNSGDGESCWSLNPITVLKCALRWAFVPTTIADQWSELADNLRSKPPFSIVYGGFTWAWEFVDMTIDAFGTEGSGTACLDPTGGLPEDFVDEMSNEICVSEGVQQFAALEFVVLFRVVLSFLLLFGIAYRVWLILKSAFGGESVSVGSEEAAPEREGDE